MPQYGLGMYEDAHEQLPAGTVVGDVVVECALGIGAAAVVYRVWHRPSRQWQALKVLRSRHPELRARLEREAHLQSTLRHPHVLPVFEVCDVGGTLGIRMDYVHGPTLESWMQCTQPRQDEALAMFRGVAVGLGAAHAQGLVHRDLKPGNVLLRADGALAVPLVADFGLARSLVVDQRLTGPGAAMGTPAYMAPEQFVDAGEVDRRADIWSLGVILYELLTGHRPFPESDLLDLMQHVARGDYVDPRVHQPDLSDRLVEAIEGCLAVDKRERFHDVGQLLAFVDQAPETAFVQRAASVGAVAPAPATDRTVGLDVSMLAEGLLPTLPAHPPTPLPARAPGRVTPIVASAVLAGAGAVAAVLCVAAVGVWLAS